MAFFSEKRSYVQMLHNLYLFFQTTEKVQPVGKEISLLKICTSREFEVVQMDFKFDRKIDWRSYIVNTLGL